MSTPSQKAGKDNFICNVKGHEAADFTMGNGGVIDGVRTITALCRHCRKDIELTASLRGVSEWRLRAFPAS